MLDALEALARAREHFVKVLDQVGQVDALDQLANLRRDRSCRINQQVIDRLIKLEQRLQLGEISLQDEDVVGDEREGIVDLMGDAGDQLAQGR